MILQSIDPGKPKRKHLGRALFEEGKLTRCGLWDLVSIPWKCDSVVIEKPTIYPQSPVPPNDILEVAIVAGRAAQALGYERCKFVLPRTWKGTVDGNVMLERIIRTLTDDERRVYFAAADLVPAGYREHFIDAIGLGLYWFKRRFV